MIGKPERDEADEYYFRYIDRISGDHILDILASQMEEMIPLFSSVSEDESLHRYEPGKWSIRQVLNHVNDCERLFVARAFWFARGFDSALPSFDQNISAEAARADEFPWSAHVEEFRAVRLATLSFFGNLPDEAWMRRGTASGCSFTVRALAYLAAGHAAHHVAALRERYL
jgi:uncharacterized damage-inducible protein DinB